MWYQYFITLIISFWIMIFNRGIEKNGNHYTQTVIVVLHANVSPINTDAHHLLNESMVQEKKKVNIEMKN